LERKNLDTAMSRLNELLTKQDSEKIQTKELPLDGALSISAITIDLLEQLETAGPFGAGASSPKVCNSIYARSFCKKGW
jgi:single-stranded-DNA-specific exonuclease